MIRDSQSHPSPSTHLRIFQLNMRHSGLSRDLLVDFLHRHPCDVLLLQDICPSLQLPSGAIRGFSLFLPTRGTLGEGSSAPLVAVLVRSTLTARPIDFGNCRMCGAFIPTRLGLVACISAYIQHGTGRGLDHLSLMLSTVWRNTPFLLVGADVNGHNALWGPVDQLPNPVGARVEELITMHNLAVANILPSLPTFVSDRGFEAWLDVSLVSSRLQPWVSSWAVVDEFLGSDHKALLWSIATSGREADIVPRLDWRAVDWDQFRTTLRLQLERLFPGGLHAATSAELNSQARLLDMALQSAIDQHVPVKRLCWASNPWWSKDLAAMRLELNRLSRKWARSRAPADKQVANAYRRRFRRAISDAKQRSWQKLCEEATDEDFWEGFRKVTKPRGAHQVATLEVDGRHITDDQGKAQVLLDKFFPLPTASSTTSPSHAATSSRAQTILQAARGAVAPRVTPAKLHSAIWAAGAWKAAGPDRVTNICFRECETLLRPFLLALFSASLALQTLPPTWRIAQVVAVPKPGGDGSTPKAYRPISLISCLSKLLERIVTSRVSYFLEHQGRLSAHQFGFRRTRSTELALWRFVEAATEALKVRRKVVMVSLDIQSAYDRVWHAGLLVKLADAAVPPALLGWIWSFLIGRTAILRVGSASLSRSLAMGVPQGSPLSPLLFLVYIDDLLRAIHPLAQAQAFADDVIIWWVIRKGRTGSRRGNRVLEVVGQWAVRWKMHFHPSKCRYLLISRLRDGRSPSLFLDGVALASATELRYLGVWLDPKLSWAHHVAVVTGLARRRLRLIHRGAGTMWGFHPRILHRLIHATIFPLMFYAAPVWCPVVAFSSRLRPLDQVIRLSAICTLGLLRTVPCAAALALTGYLPAELQLRERVAAFHLRQLGYGRDVHPELAVLGLNRMACPSDILRKELRELEDSGHVTTTMLSTVDRHVSLGEDPSAPEWGPMPTILSRALAPAHIRRLRQQSSPSELWIFTDGSVVGLHCGAAAVFYTGASQSGTSRAVAFVGHHSSTQAELVALGLGSSLAPSLGCHQRVSFVSDSQPALLAIQHHAPSSALAMSTRIALRALRAQVEAVRFLWTPSHVGSFENDCADEAAKRAAQGQDVVPLLSGVPTCRTSIRSRLRHHYLERANTLWAHSSTGRALYSLVPQYSTSLQWTRDLSRKEVALVAQFLTDHYASASYLRRFGHPFTGSCPWCPAPVDDRDHRLFHCPRFRYVRQQLTAEIEEMSSGEKGWTWDFLAHEGRRYLARFLRTVQGAIMPALELAAFHDVDEGEMGGASEEDPS